MNRSGISLFTAGFFIGVATCIFAVTARLRASTSADDWAVALLLYPCAAALALSLMGNAISFHLLKAGIRSLRSRGVDIEAQLNKLATEGNSSLRYAVRTFFLFQSMASLLGGYFVCSIFLAPYLILR